MLAAFMLVAHACLILSGSDQNSNREDNAVWDDVWPC